MPIETYASCKTMCTGKWYILMHLWSNYEIRSWTLMPLSRRVWEGTVQERESLRSLQGCQQTLMRVYWACSYGKIYFGFSSLVKALTVLITNIGILIAISTARSVKMVTYSLFPVAATATVKLRTRRFCTYKWSFSRRMLNRISAMWVKRKSPKVTRNVIFGKRHRLKIFQSKTIKIQVIMLDWISPHQFCFAFIHLKIEIF